MTDTKTYNVRGADVTITASIYPYTVDIVITVDLTPLDSDEPSHSPHQLINYLHLQGYQTGQSYWWCKTSRKVTVRTGSQAQRVIKHALAKIDDAVYNALAARVSRKSQIQGILS